MAGTTYWPVVEEKRIVVEEPEKRTWEVGEQRFVARMLKTQTMPMNMKRRPSHCLSLSFQRR
jgi:hypothetical protein